MLVAVLFKQTEQLSAIPGTFLQMAYECCAQIGEPDFFTAEHDSIAQ